MRLLTETVFIWTAINLSEFPDFGPRPLNFKGSRLLGLRALSLPTSDCWRAKSVVAVGRGFELSVATALERIPVA